MTMLWRTVLPVWVAAVVVAVLVGVLAGRDYLEWMPVAMAALVLMTFVVQLVAVQKEGLVDRMLASLGGGILILGVATGVLALVSIA